jgi:hypothetical protein
MTDALHKAIDIAKKLRRAAKKVADPAVQSLITDLSLSLADLKVHLVEQRMEQGGEQDVELRTGEPHTTPRSPSGTQSSTQSGTQSGTQRGTPAEEPVSLARDAGFGGLRNFPS